MDAALVVAGVVFCLVAGANDGAALASMSARVAPGSLGLALLVLAVSVAIVPLLSVGVALTLTERLVDFGGGAGARSMLVAVAVAVGIVALLAGRGQPTSLTLALVGALGGAGFGAGLPVAWGWLGGVLAAAAFAPVLAAGIAALTVRGIALLPSRGPLLPRLRVAHRAAFLVQALAYALNDGQKMLAVAALAVPTRLALEGPGVVGLAVIGVLFLVGSVLGLRRVGRTLSDGILPLRPPDAVTAEFAAAAAVIGSSLVAAPVSMTQAITGGLLGSSARTGYRRVRWGVAVRLVQAWAVTLPASFLGAAGVGSLWRWIA